MNTTHSVSVIIPTLNAGKTIESLLKSLKAQTILPFEIIVVDSESNDGTRDICLRNDVAAFIEISRSEFNHGTTRDLALRQSHGDFIMFLTQDAIPADNYLVENLLSGFTDDSVAAVFGRQLPKSDAIYTERLVREFNYPDYSFTRSISDLPEFGIKTFFLSDVCAMYRRDIYLSVGGFEHSIKTNEDMFFSAAALQKGYTTSYRADAKVYHSHNLSLREQYERNYTQGYEIEKHRELLQHAGQNSQGMKLVKYVSKKALSSGHIFSWIYFCFDCCARFLGSKMGKRAAEQQNKI